jgi:hypothetical protein
VRPGLAGATIADVLAGAGVFCEVDAEESAAPDALPTAAASSIATIDMALLLSKELAFRPRPLFRPFSVPLRRRGDNKMWAEIRYTSQAP